MTLKSTCRLWITNPENDVYIAEIYKPVAVLVPLTVLVYIPSVLYTHYTVFEL